MNKLPSPALAALLLALPAVADTLIVGPPGSGADFEGIAEAIESAAPGDTVLVLAGDYQGFKTLVIDKPLALIGAGSAVTKYSALPDFPLEAPLPLLVRDLAPGEEVRVAGLKLRSFASLLDGPTVAVVQDCEGPVTLADVSGNGSPALWGGSGVAQVRGSSQVLLDGCSFQSLPAGQQTASAQPGLLVENSEIHVNACSLTGAAGVAMSTGPTTDGAPGIEAVGSLVRLSRSIVNGGAGGGNILFLTSTQVTDGGPALSGAASTFYARGGTGNALVGGKGGVGEVSGSPIYGAGSPAIVLATDSVATTTPDVAVQAGADGDGVVTAPAVAASGTWVELLERMALLAVEPTVVAPGAIASVELGGEPGALHLTFFAFAQGPVLVVPGVPGVVVLPLGGFASLPAATLGPGGEASLPVLVPEVPELAGVSLVVQGLGVSPLGTLSISAPSLVAIAQ